VNNGNKIEHLKQHCKNGFLVPVKNVPALVNAMEKFIHHPQRIKTMGQESRKIAVEKYDVHKVNTVILKRIATNCTNIHEYTRINSFIRVHS